MKLNELIGAGGHISSCLITYIYSTLSSHHVVVHLHIIIVLVCMVITCRANIVLIIANIAYNCIFRKFRNLGRHTSISANMEASQIPTFYELIHITFIQAIYIYMRP